MTGTSKQEQLDELDEEFLRQGLPEEGVARLAEWWAANGGAYAGGPEGHSVTYRPSAWAGIEPWPEGLADRSGVGDAKVSRRDVFRCAAEAAGRQVWREALVASFVWGKGKKGGFDKRPGPQTVAAVLAPAEQVERNLRAAVAALADRGPGAAYELLAVGGSAHIAGLGPSFFTKFLYFADPNAAAWASSRALILDQRVAARVRGFEAALGAATGLDPDGTLSDRAWKGSNWTAHRYRFYLRWMDKVANQLALRITDFPRLAPDLLELALFQQD